MDLSAYFDGTDGYGILATADSRGRADAAIYAKPHFFDDKKVGFIMADRLTHKNLQSNPHAAYLFIEAGGDYNGSRSFLVVFRVEKVRPLVGG